MTWPKTRLNTHMQVFGMLIDGADFFCQARLGPTVVRRATKQLHEVYQ